MLKNLKKALLDEYCEVEILAMDRTIFKNETILSEIFKIIDNHTIKEQNRDYRDELCAIMSNPYNAIELEEEGF